jgi:hypothetical protein
MPVATASTGGMPFFAQNYQTGGAGRVSLGAGGQNPGATGADNVLAVFSLPGSLFDGVSNRGIRLTAMGTYGANGNTKTVKIIYNPSAAVVGSTVTGGTTLVTTGAVVINALPWFLEAGVVDVVGANNQLAFGMLSWSGGVPTFIVPVAPSFATADETQPILIAVTGNAATAVTDIALLYFSVKEL